MEGRARYIRIPAPTPKCKRDERFEQIRKNVIGKGSSKPCSTGQAKPNPNQDARESKAIQIGICRASLNEKSQMEKLTSPIKEQVEIREEMIPNSGREENSRLGWFFKSRRLQ